MKFHFTKKIEKLIRKIETHERLTPSLAKKILEESELTTGDVASWSDFEHSKEDSYGRKLVYNGDFFELMVMSWVDGDMAAIHDHGHTQWGAVKLLGAAEHATFKITDDKLTTTSREFFQAGSVLAVNHDMIHQMGNIGQQPYLTVHLYGAYDVNDGITSNARLYDLDEGKIQFTDGGVFFDLPEAQINRRIDGPKADFPTTIRCKTELSYRLFAKHNSLTKQKFGCDRESKIAKQFFDGNTWDLLHEDITDVMETSTSTINRYKNILDQELFMTARLQGTLVGAEMINPQSTDIKSELSSLLKMAPGTALSIAYLRFLQGQLGAESPLVETYQRAFI